MEITRNGRRGENSKPVEKENSLRHSGGRQLISPAMTCSGACEPATTSLGEFKAGEHVVDVGCGAGFDSLIAAQLVGPTGHLISVDMTPEMLKKAQDAATEVGVSHIEFREGFAESLPVDDGWADVVISNGVVNLCPDKPAVFQEMYRVLKPGGRIRIADILVQKAVPEDAKRDVDLWTG